MHTFMLLQEKMDKTLPEAMEEAIPFETQKTEEEKKKISTNLHDELGSMAVALSSYLTITEEEIKDKNWQSASKNLAQLHIELKKAVNNFRNIIIKSV